MWEVRICCDHQDGEEDEEKERPESVHDWSDQGEVRRSGHISSLETLIRSDQLFKKLDISLKFYNIFINI